jgi:hypothetical protein
LFSFSGPKNSEAEATPRVVQEDAGQRHHRANRARLQRHLQASPRGQPPVRGRTPLLRGRLLAQRDGGEYSRTRSGKTILQYKLTKPFFLCLIYKFYVVIVNYYYLPFFVFYYNKV